ncbi:MAG: hypothetical protein D6701_09405 [Gemmatimonadetes bacterium]|nr:MAG: hypothetical protein D6701_09405 [Gemmatimonadota bacterium]
MLAADPEGSEGIAIDNFLLFRVATADSVDHFMVGLVSPIHPVHVGGATGPVVRRIGPARSTPGPVDLTGELPVGRPFMLTAWALDYGGVGYISDVYLVLSPPDVPTDTVVSTFTLGSPTVRDTRFAGRQRRLRADIDRAERNLADARSAYDAARARVLELAERTEEARRALAEAETRLEEARVALASLPEEAAALELDLDAMPPALANLVRAKRSLEERAEAARERLVAEGETLDAEERARILEDIASAERQLEPIERAIATRMADLDARPRGEGGPVTYAQLEADREAVLAWRPELEELLEIARGEWEDALRTLREARTDLSIAQGQADLERERMDRLQGDVDRLREELDALGWLGELATIQVRASDRVIYLSAVDSTAFDLVRSVSAQLGELRRERLWFDVERRRARERFVDLTNEVIALESDMVNRLWFDFIQLYRHEANAAGRSLGVSALFGGPVGVIADAAVQMAGVFVFNEGGVAFEHYDESAMRRAFHQRKAEIEAQSGGGADADACSGTAFEDYARVELGAPPVPRWSAGVRTATNLADQAWAQGAKDALGQTGEWVRAKAGVRAARANLEAQRRELIDAMRNGRSAARGTTAVTGAGGPTYGSYHTAINRERRLLEGWTRRLDEFRSLKAWGRTGAKGVGSFLAGMLFEEYKDWQQSEILAEERDAWAELFTKELEASLAWMVFMRTGCAYWTLSDEVAFLAPYHERLRATVDPLAAVVITQNDPFTNQDELVVSLPWRGRGNYRLEVTVGGVRGEPRGAREFVFPPGSFDHLPDGTRLELVVEVVPN